LGNKFDITKHVLVPPFRKLSPEECEKLLKKYNISPLQLPAIKSKDPMVKFANAKVGDIIEIERKSPLGKKHLFYRRVIP